MSARVTLFGNPSTRPEGLERALVRAGFALAETAADSPLTLPDLAILTVGDAGSVLESALAGFPAEAWSAVPVIVLLGDAGPDGVARAFALGATDVLTAPVNLGELCARLEARLRIGAELRRAAAAGALQSDLFRCVEAIALARHPGEMLDTLTHRLGSLLAVEHCACLALSADRRYARLVAVHENPALRDVSIDLFRYPEAVEAAMSVRTVYAPEVLRDRLFLSHLAQWPDSPEVHAIESAVAVPLLTNRSVHAVLVMRTRRGDPVLTPEQVVMVERVVNATGTLVEREERRADLSRRHSLAASTDPLTRCASLDALDRRLREELQRVQRYGSQLAFALLDITALRELNHRLGDSAGDRFLADLGAILLQEVRTPDFVGRYAGDEFALLLPATGVEGARRILARIATRLGSYRVGSLDSAELPRLAAGVVVVPHAGLTRVEDLLAAAEAALVRGKTKGGDGVGVVESVAA